MIQVAEFRYTDIKVDNDFRIYRQLQIIDGFYFENAVCAYKRKINDSFYHI